MFLLGVLKPLSHGHMTSAAHEGEIEPAIARVGKLLTSRAVRTFALIALYGAYLQGGINKAIDFDAAIAEMHRFGLAPEVPFAAAVIFLELGGSVLIVSGFYRWVGALLLAGFTLFATFIANRFWEVSQPERFMLDNSFFDHLGLVGGFLLFAWHDLRERWLK
jgi:uncharacterized membrane protein YphA (DoxX/SURF4 family)